MVTGTNVERLKKYQCKIGGMHCSFCASSISQVISKLPGIENVNVSLAHEEALIQYDPEKVQPPQIDNMLRSLGYTVRDPNKIRSFEEEDAQMKKEKDRLLGSAVLTFAALGLMILMWFGIKQPFFPFVMIVVAFGNVFGFGLPILKMAFQSMRRGILNQHVLMELAAFGGMVGGFLGLFYFKNFPAPDFFAVSVFITTYHLLGGYSSLKVRTKTSQAVRKLLALQPPTARAVREGNEIVVSIEQIQKGELVRVKPGESIPVDGVVLEGQSTIDESLITGESISVEKTVGSIVTGGSINQAGSIMIKVTRVGQESFLQQVARYIEESRAMKPGVLQLLDVMLKYFVPGVIVSATAGFLVWSLGSWLASGHPDIERASFATLAALVMGYPCALGMATPLAMIRGGGMAAQKGILFRSSESFHVFKDIDSIVLDKTGTITYGKPSITEIYLCDVNSPIDALRLAASAENLSEHPLAKAIVKRAKERGIEIDKVSDFESIPGKGVKGILDGKNILVGTPEFVESQGVQIDEFKVQIDSMEGKGQTIVAACYDGNLAGLIALADTIKTDAADTISKLKEIGIEPIMITGDNEGTARAVSEMVGIKRIFFRVLPNQKADKIRELQSAGHKVVMVGDGINDAPALMQADIGIALGAGTDIAIESADIIIIGEKLNAIIDAYHISTSSYSKTKQNLAIAFAFNGIGVPAAATGLVHPAWAMFAMALSVTFVIANSFGSRLVPRTGNRKKDQMKTITLKIPSIHCDNCLSNIVESLSDIEGIISVQGDQDNKLVDITYKGRSEVEEQVKNKIFKLGHVIV